MLTMKMQQVSSTKLNMVYYYKTKELYLNFKNVPFS